MKSKYPEQQPKGKQYPDDWAAPLRGTCERCGYETRGYTTQWLNRCPYHWQNLRVDMPQDNSVPVPESRR